MSQDTTSSASPQVRALGARAEMNARSGRNRIGGLLQTYGLIAVIVVVAIIFAVLTDGTFLSSRNVPILLRQAAVTGIVAAGVSLVIIGGEIDLSIGSAVGLCAILVAWLMKVAGWNPLLAGVATLAVGLIIGVWQGVAIARLGIPSFVVTLGGLMVFQGIGLVITGGNTIASFPDAFLTLAQGSLGPATAIPVAVVVFVLWLVSARTPTTTTRSARGRALAQRMGIALIGLLVVAYVATSARGLPVPVLLMVAIALALHVLAVRTRFGRHLYATGGNRDAARLAGIAVTRVTFTTFVLMGALYALTGMLLAARLNGAPPGGAPFLELEAIAAAVIGGVSLRGGVGRVGNALLGALLLAAVNNGLSLMNVPTFYQMIVSGLILITAVYLDTRARRAAG